MRAAAYISNPLPFALIEYLLMLKLPAQHDKSLISPLTSAQTYSSEMMNFQHRVSVRAGLPDRGTYLPAAIHPQICGKHPKTDLNSAQQECNMAVFGCLEGLLAKTGVHTWCYKGTFILTRESCMVIMIPPHHTCLYSDMHAVRCGIEGRHTQCQQRW